MSDISERIAALSPEKRALLTQQLRDKETGGPQLQKIARRSASGPAPLSFGQRRLWFLDQLRPGQPFYNLFTAIRLTGPLNPAKLKRSLNEVVRRHEVLRTTFAEVNEQTVQIVAPMLTMTLPVQDLQSLSESEQDARIRQLAAEQAQQPFDLTQGPLLRVTLLRLGEEQHVFLLTMHHIISDLWSQRVFMRELLTLYDAFSADRPSSLPDLPVQYADFAHWQRHWMQGEILETQLSYWREQLDGIPTLLRLPTDRPRPAIQNPGGAARLVMLPHALCAELKALSQQEGVTLFMTLLAAFEVLLYRYTGQEDIVTGTPIAGRNWSETEDMIGFFANTLVLRTDLSGNPTFRQLLERVREMALAAYSHPDAPFEKLVEELAPERSLSHTPLFQVMFALQNVPPPDVALTDLGLEVMTIDVGTARFDLSLLVDMGTRPSAALVYNTDLFDADTITRMLGHFQTLLESVVADPGQRISDSALLTDEERRRLVVDWNQTGRDYPLDRCLHQLFTTQVNRTPRAVALSSEEGELTYRELGRRSNQLAHFLQGLGVGPNVVVGICLERSLDMVVGILGVLKAGGAYLPLDPGYPPERLAFILQDAQVPVLLTQAQWAPRLPEAEGVRVVCLDSDGGGIARQEEEEPVCQVTAEDPAYVIYTSGSTGSPKGVVIPHQGVVNRLSWVQEELQIDPSDHVLQKTPFVFDVSVGEIFLPLLNGARLVVARPRGHLDSAYLAGLIEEHEITFVHFVPSMLNVFLEEPGIEACNASLRYVWCGGEVLPFKLKERFFERLEAKLYNGYGPTETSIGVTVWACGPGGERQIVPIGRPIANTQVYILDQYLNPVPVGVPGELYVGGVGLALGYLNRPDLTEKSFIPNPFGEHGNGRLYRTGDLARYLPDGAIEFLGRVDHQVKIRGFRIELEEIEAVLAEHSAIRQSVVLVQEDEEVSSPTIRVGKRLVAYFTVEQGQVPTSHDLRSFLTERIPEYMIPSSFLVLDALPLTPTGKIDRDAVLAADGAALESEVPQVAPRSDLEQIIADTWRDALDMDEEVGVDDNFFDLGGHSLLLVLVRGELQEKLGKDIPVAELFEYPTISALARHLEQAQAEEPSFAETQDRAAMQREAARQQMQLGQRRS
jgi:amino acid adenylation domain-containing protein